MSTWLILEDDRFNFDYCHFLPWHASQCASLHGHSSVITVMLQGELDDTGMVVDFGEDGEAFQTLFFRATSGNSPPGAGKALGAAPWRWAVVSSRLQGDNPLPGEKC